MGSQIAGMSRKSSKAGLPPGTLVHIGRARTEHPEIKIVAFGPESHRSETMPSWSDALRGWGNEPVRWINIDGVHVPALVEDAGGHFGLHALELEDVMDTGHRPSYFELDGSGMVLVLKMIGLGSKGRKLRMEQITVVVRPDAVLSFQERKGDLFDGLRERLAIGKGMTRRRGADYLAYRLVDTVVDHYFHITDHLMDGAESLEVRILEEADTASMQELQRLKKMMVQLRRAATPLREAIALLLKEPPAFVEAETVRHWHDVHDHLLQVNDQLEILRETFNGLMDLHANGVNQRTNQVMQLMTMVATIFIPLTFIAGVYGMNFEHMPELHWKYSYAGVWLVMLAVAGGMFRLFRKRGWI